MRATGAREGNTVNGIDRRTIGGFRSEMPRRILWLAGLAAVFGCAGDLTPVVGCESFADFEVDCKFQNPEDLAPGPDGRILVSQFGGMDGAKAGNLAVYDSRTKKLDVLFPNADELVQSWGEAACAPPPLDLFSPHGIDIEERDDGRLQLAVVNHGGRESVELFEVMEDSALRWRGCVLGPEDAFFNDVVLLRDGSFWVSHMFEHGTDFVSMMKASFGRNTGWVYAWEPGGGFRKLAGSDAPFPNGLEKSADERFLYLNSYSNAGVRKIDVASGDLVASAEVKRIDNSTWAADGRLLVASHTGNLAQMMACMSVEEGSCGMPFEIVALDPNDMSSEVVIRSEGAPMGGVTVALEHEGAIYLGTFAGDRLGRIVLPYDGAWEAR